MGSRLAKTHGMGETIHGAEEVQGMGGLDSDSDGVRAARDLVEPMRG